jgi:hypothetical protein
MTRIGRLCLAAVVLLVLGMPAIAGAQSEEAGAAEESANPQVSAVRRERNPRSCKVIEKQIARYTGVAEMARERGDEMWEESTEAHIDRLTLQHQRRCPQDVASNKNAERMARLLRLAAKGFMKAMTFGAF